MLHVKNFELPKWLILVDNTLEVVISLVNHEDLWLFNETSKRNLHKFAQINVNNCRNLKLHLHNLKFRACVDFDVWQAVCADLKEVPILILIKDH